MQMAEASHCGMRLTSTSRSDRETGANSLRSLHVTIAIAAWTFLAASAIAADLPARFDPTRDAAADVAHAQALAKVQGKRVIVDVGGEWCTWCHIMDRFIDANADLRTRIDAHFVWVKVNFSPQNRNDELLSRWPQITGYPHLFVLDANGKLLHSQDTSELEAGKSYDKRRFLDFVDRWSATGAATSRT